MPELDPYGIHGTTEPQIPEHPGEPLPVPISEEEVALARDVPAEERISPSADAAVSDLDPALRLQDGVGTWSEAGDATAEEVGTPEAGDQDEPAPQPYVPLADSGGQGI